MRYFTIQIFFLVTNLSLCQYEERIQTFFDYIDNYKHAYLICYTERSFDEKNKIVIDKAIIVNIIKGNTEKLGEKIQLENHLHEMSKEDFSSLAKRNILDYSDNLYIVFSDVFNKKIITQPGEIWNFYEVKNFIKISSKLEKK